jgi:hypothetical protein
LLFKHCFLLIARIEWNRTEKPLRSTRKQSLPFKARKTAVFAENQTNHKYPQGEGMQGPIFKVDTALPRLENSG